MAKLISTARPPRLRHGSQRAAAAMAALAAVVVVGCGGGDDEVESGAVAEVGEATIEQSEFDHWLAAAARSQQSALGTTSPEDSYIPTPPDFTECVAAKEEQAQAAAEQAQGPDAPAPPPPPEEQLVEQCQSEYDLLKEQVMQFLIQAEGIEQEAEARGLSVSEEEVQTRFDDLKEQQFPNEEDFERFLEQSAMTEEDLLFRVRLDLLINEIRKDVVEEEAEPSEEEIEAYYEDHQDEAPIGEPEQRDLNVVVTRTEQQADQARRAIEDGQSFAKVAKRLSIDQASARRGGKLSLQEGQEEQALDQAVFGAERGKLVGPVKTDRGFYVFEVTDIQPGQTQSLEEARSAIVEILSQQGEQEALTSFQQEFEDRVREKTLCAEAFAIDACSNPPPEEETPDPQLPAPGQPPPTPVPPGGAPPEGAPPAPPQEVPPGGAPPPPPPGG